jgi:hypothetical protein
MFKYGRPSIKRTSKKVLIPLSSEAVTRLPASILGGSNSSLSLASRPYIEESSSR